MLGQTFAKRGLNRIAKSRGSAWEGKSPSPLIWGDKPPINDQYIWLTYLFNILVAVLDGGGSRATL
jgi:hypothetical protein